MTSGGKYMRFNRHTGFLQAAFLTSLRSEAVETPVCLWCPCKPGPTGFIKTATANEAPVVVLANKTGPRWPTEHNAVRVDNPPPQ